MPRPLLFGLCAVTMVLLPVRLHAQATTRGIHVARAAGPIAVDGRLDEASWALADSIDGLRQREPAEGATGSERTVVRVLRDDDALYVGVHAFDDEPGRIRATQFRRDAALEVDDYVLILIDGLHDHRSGFYFATNPNGAIWDSEFTGVDDDNPDWNGIWEVATRRDPTGWTAEFRIPFRTLRFHVPGDGTFGFNVQRFIRRKNETQLWQGWGRSEGIGRLLYEGELTGLDGLHRGGGIEVKPYLLGRLTAEDHDALGNGLGGGGFDGKGGLDAKVAVGPTLTADLTLNTDFAQVEVDQQVINLTRFPTFFPEKRDFFLESSGVFDFATPGRIQPFYSRRIGLGADGAAVPIVGGARVYGKAGPWTLGLLDAQTRAGDRANDLVLRAKRDLFARSYVGAIAVQRWAIDSGRPDQLAGVDIDLPLVVRGHNVEPSFWLMGSSTPAVSGTPLAWRFGTDYPNDLFDNFVSLYRVERGFDPSLGFVRRTGIWETTGHIDYTPRPRRWGIRQFDFELPTWDIIANDSGSIFDARDWETADFEVQPLGGTFQSGASFQLDLQRSLDAPADSFAIFRGVMVPPGRYWWTRGSIQGETSPAAPLSLSGLVSWGDFYTGRNTTVEGGVDWRNGGRLLLGSSISRSRVTLPQGAFTAVEVAGRAEYSFSTRTTLLGFVQYNAEDARIDFNVRFHWIPVIGDDLYVVWNSGYPTDGALPHRFPSSYTLKRPLNGAVVVKATHRLSY
ncbi:MAG: carbohydrate binding family 9 domain-containing protein [Gemmatimonadetes bacterium]|nr:carbohydrate binding family 9 domain-containing protein [Gemmatimonadota bacterium]